MVEQKEQVEEEIPERVSEDEDDVQVVESLVKSYDLLKANDLKLKFVEKQTNDFKNQRIPVLNLFIHILQEEDAEIIDHYFNILILQKLKYKRNIPTNLQKQLKEKLIQKTNQNFFFYDLLVDYCQHKKTPEYIQVVFLFLTKLLQYTRIPAPLLHEFQLKSPSTEYDFYLNFQLTSYKQFQLEKYKHIQSLQKVLFQSKFKKIAFYSIQEIVNGTIKLDHYSLEELEELCKLLSIRIDLESMDIIDPYVPVKDDIEMDEELSDEEMDLMEEDLHAIAQEMDTNLDPNLYKVEIIRKIKAHFAIPKSQIYKINSISLYPTEIDCFQSPQTQTSLTTSFLSLFDYLYRNFILYKQESSYEIKQDIKDSLLRLQPRYNPDYTSDFDKTVFNGWSANCTLLTQFQISDVGINRLTETLPQYVKCELTYDLSNYSQSHKSIWDEVKPRDTLYLIAIEKKATIDEFVVGKNDYELSDQEFSKKYGIKYIRGCEVYELLDDDQEVIYSYALGLEERKKVEYINRDIHEDEELANRTELRIKSDVRAMRVLMDPNDYVNDVKDGEYKVYGTFNLLLRRDGKKNNCKSVLESIRDLMQSEHQLPPQLSNAVLGKKFENDNVGQVDFGHVFKNFKELNDCFKCVQIKEKNSPELRPPFKVTFNVLDKNGEMINECRSYPRKKYSFVETEKIENVNFTKTQIEAIKRGSLEGLTLIIGPPGTGKTDVAAQIIENVYNQSSGKILLITKSNKALDHLFSKIKNSSIPKEEILRLGGKNEDWGNMGRVEELLRIRKELLDEVEILVKSLGEVGDHATSCEQVLYFYNTVVKPKILAFRLSSSEFPFIEYMKTKVSPSKQLYTEFIDYVEELFEKVGRTRPYELLRSGKDRQDYLLLNQSRIIAMTCTYAALHRRDFIKLGFKYETLIIEESAQMLDIETFIPLILQDSALKRTVMIGDDKQLPPVIQDKSLVKPFSRSMFERILKNNHGILLDVQFRARSEICDLYRSVYPSLKDYEKFNQENPSFNPGFEQLVQVINVGDYKGRGESFPRKHFIQNLGEAEYVVQTFMYMRYPLDKIAILTTYNGQKELIYDVLVKRCKHDARFGMPAVDTVDRFQGQEKDYVLLSLVRTNHVGHLKDERRLTVALSRARLGLYIFCRLDLFVRSQVGEIFKFLEKKGKDLKLVKTEKFDDKRRDKGKSTTVKDVVEMGILVENLGN